jgi:hypothetical protein
MTSYAAGLCRKSAGEASSAAYRDSHFPTLTLTRGWTSTDCVEVPAGVNFVDRWDPRVDDEPTFASV